VGSTAIEVVKINPVRLLTHVSHFPQIIDKEIERKCINLYISV
jgi:hypothetical protein